MISVEEHLFDSVKDLYKLPDKDLNDLQREAVLQYNAAKEDVEKRLSAYKNGGFTV